MIDYFISAEDTFLRGMGVDRTRLPAKDKWLREVLADHKAADDKKDRFYLAWLYNGEQIGHSSIIRSGLAKRRISIFTCGVRTCAERVWA
jgi:hypothetical protein